MWQSKYVMVAHSGQMIPPSQLGDQLFSSSMGPRRKTWRKDLRITPEWSTQKNSMRFNHIQRGLFVYLSTLTLGCIHSCNTVLATLFHMLTHWFLFLFIHLFIIFKAFCVSCTAPRHGEHNSKQHTITPALWSSHLVHSTHGDWIERPRKVIGEQVTSWKRTPGVLCWALGSPICSGASSHFPRVGM